MNEISIETMLKLSALVPYPSVWTPWSSFVPQEAANTLVEMTGQPPWRWTIVVRSPAQCTGRQNLSTCLSSHSQDDICNLSHLGKQLLCSQELTRLRKRTVANASGSSAYLSPTSLGAALSMINQSGHIGDLKLHSGVLTRHLLPELCQKRSTRHPVGGAPLREPTPLQPQHPPGRTGATAETFVNDARTLHHLTV